MRRFHHGGASHRRSGSKLNTEWNKHFRRVCCHCCTQPRQRRSKQINKPGNCSPLSRHKKIHPHTPSTLKHPCTVVTVVSTPRGKIHQPSKCTGVSKRVGGECLCWMAREWGQPPGSFLLLSSSAVSEGTSLVKKPPASLSKRGVKGVDLV